MTTTVASSPSHCECPRHCRGLTLPTFVDDGQADRPSSPWAEFIAQPQHQLASARSSVSDVPGCHCVDGCPLSTSRIVLPMSPVGPASPSTQPFAGKTVVLLRTSSTARAPVYEMLGRKGLRIVVVQPSANRKWFPAVDDWIECDTTCVDDLEKVLGSSKYKGTFDAVASFDEYGVFPAAQLNARLGKRSLPLSPAMLSTVNIKSRFRVWCRQHNLSAPRFAPLHTPAANARDAVAAAGLMFPLVVKPAPGAGSNLVQLVDTAADLDGAVARLWAAIEAMRPTAQHFEALGEPIHVLLEEFVEGPEVDVDAIVVDGRVQFAAVSDNFPTVRPYFSEVGGLAPSVLPANQRDSLVQLLEAFVDATSAEGERLTGVLHFEAKYDARRQVPVIIEVNCRMGSAETHTMIEGAYGVDLAEAAMRLALDMPLQPLPDAHVRGRAAIGTTGRFCASANLYPATEGTLVALRTPPPGGNLLRSMPFPLEAGAAVRLPPHSFGCLIWLAASGATADEAVSNMKELSAQAVIEIA